MTTTRPLYTRLPEAVHAAVLDLSTRTGRSISDIVSELLARQLGMAKDPSRMLTQAIKLQQTRRTHGNV
jgi:hypothetical protein